MIKISVIFFLLLLLLIGCTSHRYINGFLITPAPDVVVLTARIDYINRRLLTEAIRKEHINVCLTPKEYIGGIGYLDTITKSKTIYLYSTLPTEEDEIAAILAHEYGHFMLHHYDTAKPDIEKNADIYGMHLLKEKGYDPCAMARVLQKITNLYDDTRIEAAKKECVK